MHVEIQEVSLIVDAWLGDGRQTLPLWRKYFPVALPDIAVWCRKYFRLGNHSQIT